METCKRSWTIVGLFSVDAIRIFHISRTLSPEIVIEEVFVGHP